MVRKRRPCVSKRNCLPLLSRRTLSTSNRPFATSDHVVQNPPCWRASSLLFSHWDIKTKRPEPMKLDLPLFWCPSGGIIMSLPYSRMPDLYHVIASCNCKRPIVKLTSHMGQFARGVSWSFFSHHCFRLLDLFSSYLTIMGNKELLELQVRLQSYFQWLFCF